MTGCRDRLAGFRIDRFRIGNCRFPPPSLGDDTAETRKKSARNTVLEQAVISKTSEFLEAADCVRIASLVIFPFGRLRAFMSIEE
jgi:hypothetical protein